MAEVALQAKIREGRGKQAAKHLRQEGLIPGILYGPGEQPLPLTLNLKEFVNLLRGSGRNVVVNLAIEGGRQDVKAFIYEIQHDPISGDIIHADLKHISLQEKIFVTVPVHLSGVSAGVKNEGGMLEHILHSLEVSCLPAAIPDAITLDVTALHNGDIIHVKDIPRVEFDFTADPEAVVVHVVAPRAATDEEAGEGTTAEPEVIGKKKEE